MQSRGILLSCTSKVIFEVYVFCLKKEDFEVSSITRQLELKAKDGKYCETDVTDIKGMFRIIELIPSKNAELIKQWLAHLEKKESI